MRTVWGVFLAFGAAALLGCPPGRTWESRVEEPEYMPPPPEVLLRKPADFRLFDPHGQREYFLYYYEDEQISEIIITVLNKALPEPDQRPRLATLDEFDYALSLFQEMWKAGSDDDKLVYFNRRHSEQTSRDATLIDQQLHYKKAELKQLEEERVDLEADLKSRKDYNVFPEGNQDRVINLPPTSTLEREILRRRVAILLAKAQIDVLEYKRRLRDAEYARVGLAVFVQNAVRVADLVLRGIEPEQLIQDIRAQVQGAWTDPQSRIEFSNGNLVLRQTRKVIDKVREWLDDYRAMLDTKDREKAAEQEKK